MISSNRQLDSFHLIGVKESVCRSEPTLANTYAVTLNDELFGAIHSSVIWIVQLHCHSPNKSDMTQPLHWEVLARMSQAKEISFAASVRADNSASALDSAMIVCF